MIMKKYSNNLYKAIKYFDGSELLVSHIEEKHPDEDRYLMECVIWYSLLDYFLWCLNKEDCDEKEAESYKEKFDTLFWMIPKKTRYIVETLLEDVSLKKSGYELNIGYDDPNRPKTVLTKKIN